MNKVIASLISVLVIMVGIFVAIIVTNPKNDTDIESDNVEVAQEEKILDECTDEYEQMQQNEMIETDSQDEKISPNCSFTIKTYYKGCGHTTNEYNNIPDYLINDTKQDLEEKYPGYEVDTFKSNEVVLYQEKEGECGEHYIVKDLDGKVVIYKKEKNGIEKMIEETSISTDYLPETDKIQIQDGIEVNGRENLNQLIEDYE